MVNKIKHGVKLPSGRKGWRAKLQDNYDGSFEQWDSACRIYNLHIKLGFSNMADAWDANPIIHGSTNPSDFSVYMPRKPKRNVDS